MTLRRRMIRGAGIPPAAGHSPSAEQMKARAAAIDELLAREQI
jgi:hypothetical protein